MEQCVFACVFRMGGIVKNEEEEKRENRSYEQHDEAAVHLGRHGLGKGTVSTKASLPSLNAFNLLKAQKLLKPTVAGNTLGWAYHRCRFRRKGSDTYRNLSVREYAPVYGD